jgi:sugar lactone lactonase YvrE
MHAEKVFKLDLKAGNLETVVELPGVRPSGLGWLPDGAMVVVDMLGRKLHKLDLNGRLSIHADLSGFTSSPINGALFPGPLSSFALSISVSS